MTPPTPLGAHYRTPLQAFRRSPLQAFGAAAPVSVTGRVTQAEQRVSTIAVRPSDCNEATLGSVDGPYWLTTITFPPDPDVPDTQSAVLNGLYVGQTSGGSWRPSDFVQDFICVTGSPYPAPSTGNTKYKGGPALGTGGSGHEWYANLVLFRRQTTPPPADLFIQWWSSTAVSPFQLFEDVVLTA